MNPLARNVAPLVVTNSDLSLPDKVFERRHQPLTRRRNNSIVDVDWRTGQLAGLSRIQLVSSSASGPPLKQHVRSSSMADVYLTEMCYH